MTAEPQSGLPSSLDAERAILGAVLLDPADYSAAAEYLRADHFSLYSHRRVFAAMAALDDEGRAIDLVTLVEELGRRKELEAVGGAAYLSSLTDGLPHSPNIEHYAKIVRDKALLRGLIHAGNSIVARAEAEEERADDILSQCEADLFALSESNVHRGFCSMREVLQASYGSVDGFFNAEARAGLKSGFHDLDAMTDGFKPQDLVVIAGRPSMGKTSLAMNIGERLAVRQGKVVGVFSLEMSRQSLLERVACSMAAVSSKDLRGGFLDREQEQRVKRHLERLIESAFFVDDTPGIRIGEMRAKARRLKHQHKGLDLLIVDYLQLMSSAGRVENRTQEVTQFSRGLKNLAKELECPVIALSQLSRKCEERSDKRPLLSDLRESGAIEQDADLVMFIYRDAVYNPTDENKGKAELIIAKQRNGPIGKVDLTWLSRSTQFETAASAGQEYEG